MGNIRFCRADRAEWLAQGPFAAHRDDGLELVVSRSSDRPDRRVPHPAKNGQRDPKSWAGAIRPTVVRGRAPATTGTSETGPSTGRRLQ
jgi:hypothetical protein